MTREVHGVDVPDGELRLSVEDAWHEGPRAVLKLAVEIEVKDLSKRRVVAVAIGKEVARLTGVMFDGVADCDCGVGGGH